MCQALETSFLALGIFSGEPSHRHPRKGWKRWKQTFRMSMLPGWIPSPQIPKCVCSIKCWKLCSFCRQRSFLERCSFSTTELSWSLDPFFSSEFAPESSMISQTAWTFCWSSMSYVVHFPTNFQTEAWSTDLRIQNPQTIWWFMRIWLEAITRVAILWYLPTAFTSFDCYRSDCSIEPLGEREVSGWKISLARTDRRKMVGWGWFRWIWVINLYIM